ncbi:MAG: N-acetyltransferase [Rhizobiaceae bacterium]|jgi:predicted N-acetyltransferase YhbS|nr:N-acetyltransferase [Rhizobiaceae bacterium]
MNIKMKSTALPKKAAVTIVNERLNQVAAREALLDGVMGEIRFRRASNRIREGRQAAISLCAQDETGALVGTVQLWHVTADGLEGALLLGPLAVAPEHQGAGIGKALMQMAIGEALGRGFSSIILVGDPEYYARFGFSADLAARLAMPGPFERHRLQARELIPGALANARGVLKAAGVKLAATPLPWKRALKRKA